MAASLPRTLPASWYSNQQLHQLERRAVFRHAWYLLGPVIRFDTTTAIDFEFAGMRATVLATDEGISVTDHDGRAVRTHITETGLAFVTFSAEAPNFENFFPGLAERLATVDFRARPHRRSIKYSGCFNWKTMVDGYQECLHCQFTHPSFSAIYPPTFYKVICHHNWCRHIADPAKPDDGLFLYFFPVCTLNVYGGGMSLFRVCPTSSPGETRMEFDYYHASDGATFEDYYQFVRQVASEDYDLCEKAQYNLERGIYTEGILNPEKEIGVAYYQQRVLQLVLSQHQVDKAVGARIHAHA